MSRKAVWIHRIMLAVLWLSFVWEFVFYFAHWSTLPEEFGIHFGPDHKFDVNASRIYGFYPHLISFAVLAVNFVITRIIIKGKLKLGLRIKEKGRRLITESIVITLDLAALFIIGYFCLWVYSVSTQDTAAMEKFSGKVVSAALNFALAGAVFQIIVNAVYREKSGEEEDLSPQEKRKRRVRFLLTGRSGNGDGAMFHRLSRIVSWIIVGMLTVIGLFILERLPSNDIADLHHGKAWFENPGGYYDKWMVFLPFIVFAPVMLVFEVISVRAGKKGRGALVVLCDRLKLIFAVFGGWFELKLLSEQGIKLIEFIIFAAVCVIAVVRYFFDRKLSARSGHDDRESG
ncbi:MAG: hypothetical protein IKO27_08700 [Ruminococcus sp.]|nr:hypothetical protein [Ruminococcus sp.]